MPINFESLLKRYVDHVGDEEGTDFIDRLDPAGFTGEEIEWMERLSADLVNANAAERDAALVARGPSDGALKMAVTLEEYAKRPSFYEALYRVAGQENEIFAGIPFVKAENTIINGIPFPPKRT